MAQIRVLRSFAGIFLLVTVLGAHAQDSFFTQYRERVAATEALQPNWATPLVTTSPRLEQGLRSDFLRQSLTAGRSSWNYGNTQGFQFIPFRRVEVRLSPPPFITHSNPRTEDGFGDVGFRMKYRLFSSSEERRNAIATFVLPATIPTGKGGNGSCCAVVTPTLELGKGFHRFDAITSAGGSLPLSNTKGLGRSVTWNNAFQLRTTKYIWVENEFNSTFYLGGKNDGKQQTFATPGVLLSRLPLAHPGFGRPARLVLTLGAGEQIALTRFKTYNHELVFTSRLRF